MDGWNLSGYDVCLDQEFRFYLDGYIGIGSKERKGKERKPRICRYWK